MAEPISMGTIVAWTSLIGALVALGFALIVWRANPRARRNRHLALLLVAEALFQATIGATSVGPFGPMDVILPWIALTVLSIAFVLFATTLEGRLARSLARPLPRALLAGICLASLALSLYRAQKLLAVGVSATTLDSEVGWAWPVFAIASIFSLVLSVNAYRSTAPGTLNRRRAGSYALAFGLRDALYAGVVVWWSIAEFVLRSRAAAEASVIVSSLTTLLFVGLLAYGILSTQLFDVDLRIKWGISRGTVASIALAAVFMVSKVVEAYASRNLGFVAGAVAAGALLFAAPRLNKLGDKVANTAMPAVQPTSEYVAFKKLEVYKAAVESAIETGAKIDDNERAMLDRLKAKLGLTEADAIAIESELAPSA